MKNLKEQLYHNLLQGILLYLAGLILYHFQPLLYFGIHKKWKPVIYFLKTGNKIGYYIPHILIITAIAAIILSVICGYYVLHTLIKIIQYRKDKTK